MHKLLFTIAIFALSFLVTSQLVLVFKGEGELMTWVFLGVGIAGFLAVLRARRRMVPPTQ